MIGTELIKGQGLGNQLFCYVTTRCIAKKQGVDFSILGSELFPNNGKSKGLYFMDMDCGIPAQKDDFLKTYSEKEDRLFTGNSRHDCKHGCYVSGVDEEFLDIADGTLLYGNMQAEKYFKAYKEDIKKWLRVREEYDSYEFYRDNLCIINIRGGEYTDSPELYLNKKYWKNAIAYMKKIRSDMEFMIITDDVHAANRLLPGIPAFHFELYKDYVTIKNASYVILSNSSFAFFPVYTSETIKALIAPKYWARHNVSNGYWASEQNIYEGWHYMDRSGKVFSSEECKAELEVFKKNSKEYARLNQAPEGMLKRLWELNSKLLYEKYHFIRLWRGLMRKVRIALHME